jgi:hypothetical protein
MTQTAQHQAELQWPYWPQERQAESWDNMAPYKTATVNGYGAAKFGGKSFNIRAIANMYGMDRPVHMAIFAREYDQLKDLHIEPIKAEMAQFIEAGKLKWNANDKQFRFTETGAILKFIQVNRPSDILKHNGKGFDLIFVDEAQQFTSFELSFFPSLCRPSAIAMAHRERIRKHISASDDPREKAGYKKLLEDTFYYPKALYCFNWGDAGHNYLVSKFWEGCSHRKKPVRDLKQYEKEVVRDPAGAKIEKWIEDPEDFTFIFADWRDNVKGYQDNPAYIRNLNRLPEPYRTAWKDGDPYAMSGLKYQIVDGIHEIDMDEKLARYGGLVPDHWRLIGALDPGTASVCAFSVYAIDPQGNRYQLTDYYKSGFSFEEHAENIYHDIKHCRWLAKGQMPEMIIAGKDAFHKKSRYAIQAHNQTFAGIFWDKYGLKLVPANTDRRLGAMAVAGALGFRIDEDSGEYTKTPNLFFACYRVDMEDGSGETKKISVCKATKDEITALKSDQHDPEDIERGDGIEDHAFDKTKYFLLGANAPAEPDNPTEDLHEHSDYGRIPKSKVYQKESEGAEYTLNDTFAETPLTETI